MTTHQRSACFGEIWRAKIVAKRAWVAAWIVAQIAACARATTFWDHKLMILSNWSTTSSGHGNPYNSKDEAVCPSIMVICRG